MSEFLKYCIENDLIRPLEEAFKEYPPEEEIHKGDPNYFLLDGNLKIEFVNQKSVE